MKNEYLFVYGTLQREFNNPFAKFLRKNTVYLGIGYIRGKKYQISWYPGVKKSFFKKDKVYGELYRVENPKRLFKVLDRYEDATIYNIGKYEYIRKKWPVIINNKLYKAWVYFYKT
ncbi:gamma-glutamylcyclotransferase family protein [Nitrosophilus labii]|uniref:gamma-glutamylcyclotransferase family protein n=1 Tax=Nitrosophilus labii TaxID=2706014 RepID=UPI0016569C30|nr:gamma-glutamylcyclotransferase family protein [Nitrosophilus labii]